MLRITPIRLFAAALLLLGLTAASSAANAAAANDRARMTPAAGDPAETWPRWRGPSGQGDVAGSGYVDRWGPEENVRWKVAVPGKGNSSPIVWGDRIFLTTAEAAGTKRSVLAFDRATGMRLWTTAAPNANPERAYPKNGHASSTPTTDGERVYAYLGNHGVLALDMDGEVVWHKSFGELNAFHGTASSPLLLGDRLILVQEQQRSPSFIAAFDRRTGEELWRTERDTQVGWSSPAAISVTTDDGEERDEIVVNSQHHVIAYAPEDGRELWRASGTTFEVIPSPVVGHDLLFSTSGRAGPTLAIRPGGSGDVTDSRIVWTAAKGSPFVVAPMLVGDYLYMVNDMASVITVYEAKTGEVLWQERLGERMREGFSAAPVAFGGKIFFTNDNGETFVIKEGPDFELLHVNRIGERTIASPALVGGVWYIRTDGHLWAIGEETG